MSKRFMMAVIGVVLGMGLLSTPAQAVTLGDSGIEISGFVDVYYAWNKDHPSRITSGALPFGGLTPPILGTAGEQPIRAFDVNADQFSLSQFKLVLEKGASPVGFRVDLSFGDTAELVNAFEPSNTEVYKMLQQAYVTYVAPVGNGLTIDFGKFVTHIGYEVIESKDNWNYSRGILFTWAIPFYHAGLRISYPVVDGVSVTLLGVNGWNNVEDNNSAKSVGAQVIVTLIPNVTLVQNVMWGDETANNSRRDVYDTIVSLDATDQLSFALNFDYGRDDDATGLAVTPGDAVWYGLAAYGRLAATETTAVALRGEWFKDVDGFSTGAVQNWAEVTVTGEWNIAESLLTRIEYRRDWANVDFWVPNGTNPKSAQDTITLGAVYTF